MKIKVQTKAGECDFECGRGENLLYAGLRHGLTLPYECATGTCGTCRARVMDGETQLQWGDAPGLSYVNLDKNELLMCQATALGDCTLRVPVTNVDGDDGVVPGYRKGRLGNLRMLTRDVASFEVALDTPLTFHAGQFVVLTVTGVVGGRAYSMVNYRPQADVLSFVVKRKPDGKFSNWLFDNRVDGSELDVFGPLGRATFHPKDGKNVLCIAGGSGIAGMMSIISKGRIESHFAKHRGYVFFGVQTSEDVFFLDDLSAFLEGCPENLEVTVALSGGEVTDGLRTRYPAINFTEGFVHAVTSERMAGRYDNIVAYVAGPPPMVDSALRMLVLEARLPGSDIRYDKFT